MPPSYYTKLKERLKECEQNKDNYMKKIQDMENEIRTLREQNMRFSADVENFKKMTEEQMKINQKYAAENIIVKLFPVLDSLENSTDASNKIILKQMMDILGKEGLSEIADVNSLFDPSKHEVIGVEDGGDENKIKTMVRKGYYFNGKLIRPEMVIIYKG